MYCTKANVCCAQIFHILGCMDSARARVCMCVLEAIYDMCPPSCPYFVRTINYNIPSLYEHINIHAFQFVDLKRVEIWNENVAWRLEWCRAGVAEMSFVDSLNSDVMDIFFPHNALPWIRIHHDDWISHPHVHNCILRALTIQSYQLQIAISNICPLGFCSK